MNLSCPGTSVKATRLSAVAMQENASDVIEVRLTDREDHLEVLRNQEVLTFSQQSWLDLKGEEGCHRLLIPLTTPQNMSLPHFFFFILNLFLIPNLIANHIHISPITPMLLALDSPHTPHLATSDPEKHTPSSSRIHSPVCRDSRRPRCWECGDLSCPPPSKKSGDPIMSLHTSRSNSAFGRAGIRKSPTLGA